MANLTMPPINWGGDAPNSQTEIVTATVNGQIAPPGPPPIYSREVLVMGSADTVRNEPGVGYPF